MYYLQKFLFVCGIFACATTYLAGAGTLDHPILQNATARVADADRPTLIKVDVRMIESLPSARELISKIRQLPYVSNEPIEGSDWQVRIRPDSADKSKIVLEREGGAVIATISVGDPDLVAQVSAGVEREARWRIIRSLENVTRNSTIRVEMRVVPVEVTKLRDNGMVEEVRDRGKPISGGQLSEGETFAFEIRNVGTTNAFVSIVDLSPDGMIAPLFPHPVIPIAVDDNKIAPDGEWHRIPPPYVVRITPPFGLEVFKIIATKEPVDPNTFSGAALSRGEHLFRDRFGKLLEGVSPSQARPFGTSDWGTAALTFQVGRKGDEILAVTETDTPKFSQTNESPLVNGEIKLTLLLSQRDNNDKMNITKEEPVAVSTLHLISATDARGRLTRVAAGQIKKKFEVGEFFEVMVENLSDDDLYLRVYDISNNEPDPRSRIKEITSKYEDQVVVKKGHYTKTALLVQTPPAGVETLIIIVSSQPINLEPTEAQAISRGSQRGGLNTVPNTLTNIGAMFGPFGYRSDIALDFYEQLLARTRAEDAAEESFSPGIGGNSRSDRHYRNLASQRSILNALGLANNSISRYDKAIDYYKQALAIDPGTSRFSSRFSGPRSPAIILSNLGLAYGSLGHNVEALKYFETALALQRQIGDRENEAITLSNVGVAYASILKYEKAIEYFQQSLAIHRELENKIGEGQTLNSLGSAYRAPCQRALLKQPNRARATKDRSSTQEIPTPCNEGIHYLERALAIAREVPNRSDEGFALNNLGATFYLLNDYGRSVDYYRQALVIYREAGNRAAQGIALNNLMFGLKALQNPGVAIICGKQAVNIYQQIRSEIHALERGLQQSFLASREDTYRTLADLLIAEGRLPEAEQVLGMLKEEEFSQYVRRDAKEIDKLSKRVGLRDDERAALARYNTIADNLTALGLELANLEDKKNHLASGAPFAEQTRYDDLVKQLAEANKAFRLFLAKELEAEVGKGAKKEIEVDRALQGKLQEWGAGTVALYTIVGEDRYRVILTTAKTQTDGKTERSAADLNQKIFAFREALQNPGVDPRPLGKELYDILIKPIENDLKGGQAQTLVWSLDGTLRYIPLAALWDGEHYLAEKYRIVVVTSTTRQSLSEPIDPNWHVLGLGVTKESKITEPFGTASISFDALPGVDKELQAIVSSEDAKQKESGVLSGKRLVDVDFTTGAMENRLGQREGSKRKYNVIHFATHFRSGGDTATSFLLLGNNQAMTLEQVSDSPEMNLTDIELVTLSACNTGYGTLTNRKIDEKQKQQFLQNNGKEVDSLAAFIEGRGAKAVLATLWPVADESTQLLMAEFYRLRKENPNLTKAEAMQRAQQAMLSGNLKPITPEGKSRAEIVHAPGVMPKDATAFKYDATKPYAHPYFWAPFILIGNWR